MPFYLGGAGIAVGILTLGFIVMRTVGKKIVKLDYVRGFSAQFATAVIMICGSLTGLPLSTTHCAIGSFLGVMLANKVPSVKALGDYTHPAAQDPAAPQDNDTHVSSKKYDSIFNEEEAKSPTNKGTILKIIGCWVATVPITLAVGAGCCALCLIGY